ncbi:MAG: hypothetical protein SVY53_10490 [Chloroflexota bacterium]|nr:hypothetical protein [Chloroflexota bacterium]
MRKLLRHGPAIHKRTFVLGALCLILALGLGGGLFTAFAVEDDYQSDASPAPGGHAFNPLHDADGNKLDPTEYYCVKCHNAEVEEMQANPHGQYETSRPCLFCHQKQQGDHVAHKPYCADCHGNQAQQLTGDAHSGMYADVNETADNANWVCKSCHTMTAIDMTVTGDPQPKPPLDIGISGVPWQSEG